MASKISTELRNDGKHPKEIIINPFYSPSTTDDTDESYPYAQYKVSILASQLVETTIKYDR